jgi:signal transduction histidine kinase/ActR/RegA family two-component response regulator
MSNLLGKFLILQRGASRLSMGEPIVDRRPPPEVAFLRDPGGATRRQLHGRSGSDRSRLSRAGFRGIRFRLRHAQAVALRAQQRLALLAEGTEILSSTFDLDEALDRVARLLVREMVDLCSIEAVEDGDLREVAIAHRDPEKERLFRETRRRYPPSSARSHPIFEVLRTGQLLRWTTQDPALQRRIAHDEEHLALMQALATDFTVVAPMVAGGQVVGVMKIGSCGRSISDEDSALLEQFAQRAGLIIDNARAYRAERKARLEAEEVAARLAQQEAVSAMAFRTELRSNERLRLLAQAGDLLSLTLDYETTLTTVAQLAVPVLADYCLFALIEGNDVRHIPGAADEAMAETLLRAWCWPAEMAASARGRALAAARPAFYPDIDDAVRSALSRGHEHLRGLAELDVISAVSVPLVARDQVLGALTFCFARSGRRHARGDLELAEELARRAAMAVENARLHRASREAIARAREANRLSEQANRAKDEFLGVVSHELRTPLNAILGWSQLLRGDKVLNPAILTKGLAVIERNSRAQVKLIEDILDVSRIISGKLRLELRPIDLEGVLRAAVEVIRPAADAKGVALRIAGNVGAMVLGDPDRLQQVLWNLLSNAVKFTPAGGEVDVAIERVGRSVRVMVIDSGKGIDPDFLPYVFERFRQADSSTTRRHGGLGLGLAIVRHVVELHGGSVRALSAGHDRGSTFVIKLPHHDGVELGSDREPGVRVTRDTDPGAMARLDGIRVLVVDDEPDAREVLGTILVAAGADVELASSAYEALESLASFAPDVLVSDVGMPGDDGYALIRQVRESASRFARVPALALTAYASPEDARHAVLAGFDTHLSKPVEPATLTAVVSRLFGKEGGSSP